MQLGLFWDLSVSHMPCVIYPRPNSPFVCSALLSRLGSTYVSAVRNIRLERGLQDPTADAPLLALLLHGIKRRYRPNLNSRQPITATILRRLHRALDSLSLTSHQTALYWAAFTLALYAFLRVSEYTSRTRTKASPSTLLRNNLTLQASTITIRLHKSKTSQYRSPPPIFIAATNTNTCPVAALQQYLSASSRDLLFVFKDGTFLSPNLLSSTLKAALEVAGYNSTGYSSHSFRIGAATSASASGMSYKN